MLKQLIYLKLKELILKPMMKNKKKISLGRIVLFGLLFVYIFGVAFITIGILFGSLLRPLQQLHLEWLYFALMIILVFMLCFIGSLFITEHEIYEAKDNQLLLSMPIKNSDILLSRIFVLLIVNYVYELIVVIPAYIVYILFVGMSFIQNVFFWIMSLTFPFLVMTITCLIAWVIAHVMKRIQKKNIVILLVWLLFFGVYFYSINYIEDAIMILIMNGQSIAQAIETYLFPVYHFAYAIAYTNLLSLCLYLLCVSIPFVLMVVLLSHRFIAIATKQPQMKKRKYVHKQTKQKSMIGTLIIREWKHFSSNAMIMLNGAIGVVFQLVATIALFFYIPQINFILEQLPFLQLTPLICFGAMALSSTNLVSASSLSLEGTSLWIVKSLPIRGHDIIKAKILFHVILCLPTQLLFCIVAGVLLHIPLWDYIPLLFIATLYIIFVAAFGSLMNLWKYRFDWLNETVCVKQSFSVVLTMLVSMGSLFVIGFLYTLISSYITLYTYMYIIMFVLLCVNLLLYYILQTWGVKRYENISC